MYIFYCFIVFLAGECVVGGGGLWKCGGKIVSVLQTKVVNA